jgi:hypothetical protein
LKRLPARGLLIFVALVLGLLAAAGGLLSLPWVKPQPDAPPHVEAIVRGDGPFAAGVGVAPIDLPAGTPIGGFPHLSYRSEGIPGPVTARALVVSSGDVKLALVSAEILLVPDALRAAVIARLRGLALSGVVLTATHTHAGPGGYYENEAYERIALGPYDPAVRDRVANAMADAVRRALETMGPARLSVARGRAPGLVKGRDGAAPEDRLTVLRVERPGGEPVAELTIFAAHATTLGGGNRRISGDWPGAFLAHAGHGTRLLLQGALGDQTYTLPAGAIAPDSKPEAYAAGVERAVDALAFEPPETTPALAFACADVPLPTPRPGAVPALLQPAATNLASILLPERAKVSALRLGPVLLVAIPGEPVAALGTRWRELAGPDAEVLSLADGYAGYVETAAHVTNSEGAHALTYYGPGLAEVLERAVKLVTGAVHQAQLPRATGAATEERHPVVPASAQEPPARGAERAGTAPRPARTKPPAPALKAKAGEGARPRPPAGGAGKARR